MVVAIIRPNNTFMAAVSVSREFSSVGTSATGSLRVPHCSGHCWTSAGIVLDVYRRDRSHAQATIRRISFGGTKRQHSPEVAANSSLISESPDVCVLYIAEWDRTERRGNVVD